tara:strand:+ start:940 stop:2814 length:1875 start_codon:yes stop_codon:yes gene_type:complete
LKYRPEIDGLRSIAVLPVILFHGGFKLFNGGFVGVDIFFVISGYLITSILIEDIENKRFSIIYFYERRARRILPAIFFLMLCCLPVAWIWSLPNHFKEFSQSIIAVSFFVSNFLYWRKSGYFESDTKEDPLLHTWSLAVEEQYYVFFPIFLFLAWKFGKKNVFWLITILAVISFFLSEWGSKNYPVANFYLSPTRAWELFVGSLTAFVVQKNYIKSNNLFTSLGFMAIIFSIFFYNQDTPFPGIYALVPVIGTALIIVYGDKRTFVAKILSTKILVGIGLISYSAYLWHQPIFAFARIILINNPSTVIILLLSVFSLFIAFLSWKFVEQPFRKKNGAIQSQKTIFSFSIFFIIFFTIIGTVGNKNDGFKNRFTKSITGDVGQLEFHQYIDKYQDCESKKIVTNSQSWKNFLRCKQSKKGTPNIVLLGDSHAEHLFLGLAESLKNYNVTFYILDEKPYISNTEFKTIFDELKNNGVKQNILLTMNYAFRLRKDKDLFTGFDQTITELKNMGKEVLLIGDVPSYSIDPAFCVYKSNTGKIDNLCKISIKEANQQKNNFHEILSRLSKKHNIAYIEISKPLCNDNSCSMIKDNRILYRDKHHLNIIGSILIADYITKIIKSNKLLSD